MLSMSVLVEISLEELLGQCDKVSFVSSGNQPKILLLFSHCNDHKQYPINRAFSFPLANISIGVLFYYKYKVKTHEIRL